MKKQKKPIADSNILRQKEESILKNEEVKKKFKHSDHELIKLIPELEMHQIDLEMQNEKHRLAKLEDEVAPSGYFTLSRKGLIIEINLCGSEMLGKSPQDLKNCFFGLFLSEEYMPIFNLFLRRIFKNHTKQTCEVSLSGKGRLRIDLHLTGILIENGDQCVVNAFDISELRRAWEALRVSEEMSRAILLQTAMDGFWRIDRQGRLLEVNEKYCQMSGYSMQELLVMNISGLEVDESAQDTAAHIEKVLSKSEDRFETRHRRKDGSIYDVEISTQYQHLKGGGIIAFLHDITERKMAERYREMAREILQILNEPGNISDLIQNVLTVLKTGIGFDAIGIRLKEGDDFPYISQYGFSRDFLLSENTLIDCTIDGGACRNQDGEIRLSCTCGLVISGKKDPKNPFFTSGGSWWTNNSFLLLDIPPARDARFHPRNKCIHQGYASVALIPIRNKEKIVGLIQLNDRHKDRLTRNTIEKMEGIASHIGSAIMRKHAEETLHESEKRRLAILETAMDGFLLLDIKGRLLEVNETYCQMSGYSAQELRTMSISALEYVEGEASIATHLQSVISKGDDRFESKHRRKDGTTFDIEVSIQYQFDDGGQFVTFLHDITERKLKEEALHKLNQILAALSKSSLAMSHTFDETEYLNRVCRIVVEDTDFSMVWIGYAENDAKKTVRPVASAGFMDDYIDTIQIRWDDSEFGRGPTGLAIRTGKIAMCNNISTDPYFEPWREQAQKRGFASSIVFPLKSENDVFGAISIYSNQTDVFFEDEINLLTELANDLALGITTIHLRAAQKLAEEALSKSFSELEKLVEERTQELQITNKLLISEIGTRKQQEQSLLAAEKKYRTVADFTANWEFWMGQNHQLNYCSPSCERITGYNASEFLNNPKLFSYIVHPADRKNFLQHNKNELHCKVYKNEIQYRIIRKDGSIRWLAHICQPVFDENGQFNGTRGSNKDITERKITEAQLLTSNQKYKILSENINDGIFICKRGKFEYLNNSVYQLFGYEKGELEHLNLTDLVQTDRKVELEKFLNTTEDLDQNFNFEVRCLKKDQSSIIVEMLLKYNAIEKMVYGVIQDVTEKKELQRNILKAIIQTEEKERSHFSKELHDGLGPLLTTIKIYLESLMRPKSEQVRNEIVQSAHDIIEESLITVKEISNNLSPHLLTNYGLQSAVKSFIEKLNKTTGLYIVLESNEYNRLPEEIEATLYRSIIECINNTLKHGNAKNIFIKMSTSKNRLFIVYVDDGVGFDVNEVLSKQAGLGLFNLQNRIQNIGGKLDLTSVPGKGVNYKFYINI